MERSISKQILAARDRLEEVLMAKPYLEISALAAGPLGNENIVGIGIGEKVIAGQATGELCVKVYVVDKAPADMIADGYAVPEEIAGVKTDVEAVGEIEALAHGRRSFRPAPGGVSIGHYKITAGTLGCLVQRDQNIFILSNNHVLANSNKAKKGQAILQPGPYDGGTRTSNIIARLEEFIPIDFSGRSNKVDAAIARPRGRRWQEWFSPFILQIGEIRGTVAPKLSMQVKKMGRTTHLTFGKIDGIKVTIRVGYNAKKVATFTDQIRITSLKSGVPFSLGGDSGSLILDKNNFACALLFAGSRDGSFTFANPIDAVLEALKVSILTFRW